MEQYYHAFCCHCAPRCGHGLRSFEVNYGSDVFPFPLAGPGGLGTSFGDKIKKHEAILRLGMIHISSRVKLDWNDVVQSVSIGFSYIESCDYLVHAVTCNTDDMTKLVSALKSDEMIDIEDPEGIPSYRIWGALLMASDRVPQGYLLCESNLD